MKEILIRYGSVTSVPITPSVIAAYRSAYKNYKEAMEMEKSQKSKETLLGKRKQPFEDQTSIMQGKKREWEEKQAQAEKLINEGTERLILALKSNKISDVLPSQALLESRNQLLKQCRMEIDFLNKQLESGHHVAKKALRASACKNGTF